VNKVSVETHKKTSITFILPLPDITCHQRKADTKKKFDDANIMIEIKACQKGWLKQVKWHYGKYCTQKKAPDMGRRNHGKPTET